MRFPWDERGAFARHAAAVEARARRGGKAPDAAAIHQEALLELIRVTLGSVEGASDAVQERSRDHGPGRARIEAFSSDLLADLFIPLESERVVETPAGAPDASYLHLSAADVEGLASAVAHRAIGRPPHGRQAVEDAARADHIP